MHSNHKKDDKIGHTMSYRYKLCKKLNNRYKHQKGIFITLGISNMFWCQYLFAIFKWYNILAYMAILYSSYLQYLHLNYLLYIKSIDFTYTGDCHSHCGPRFWLVQGTLVSVQNGNISITYRRSQTSPIVLQNKKLFNEY